MPKIRQYREVGAEFLDSAPIRGTIRHEIPASAAATFASLEDPEAWPEWLDAITEVTWTSPKPFGVGTTRDIDMKLGDVSEYFYAWEPGRRMAFYFVSGKSPMFAAFAEDYEVIPAGDDSCEIVWRYGVEMAGPAKVLNKVVAFGFKKAGVKSFAALAEYMAKNKAKYT